MAEREANMDAVNEEADPAKFTLEPSEQDHFIRESERVEEERGDIQEQNQEDHNNDDEDGVERG